MNFLLDENKQLLVALLQAGVEFIIVGGYAVNFHGYNRATGDMDIWLRPDNENRTLLIDALLSEGFDKKELEALAKADFKNYLVFSIGEEPYKVDFLTRISGVDFPNAWEQKVFLPLYNYHVPVLHLHHLVLSKISNSRPQDKADVAELQKIQAHKPKKP